MNKDMIKGQWREIKGKVKRKWGMLTDDELAQIEGTYEELEEKLHETYSCQNDEIKKQIDTYLYANYLK
ncbi:MAG: CsbD family protein [Gammaproteobacteria bacterium]|nr:MAG: CsbD family protein [Gammaproteobacteria bacterium]